jgi:hypothetical protein
VPCHLCPVLGCTVPGESNPALPATHQKVAGFSPPARVVHASAATTCSTLIPALLQEIELPVRLLNTHVKLA